MKFVLSIFLISGVALCGAASAQTTGKAIYEERCVQCHGVDGRGNGAAAPVLRPVLATSLPHNTSCGRPKPAACRPMTTWYAQSPMACLAHQCQAGRSSS